VPIDQVHTFTEPDAEQQATLVRRAKAAWFATGGSEAPDGGSGYATHEGLGYVVLRLSGAVLAVYRVRSDNLMLRRMKRPPKGLT
jgi:hypothetical protein